MNMLAPNAFSSLPPSHRSTPQDDARELSVVPVALDANAVVIPDAELLFQGAYARRGQDLLLQGEDGRQILVVDYFRQGHPADLVSPEGAVLPGAMVEKLAGAPVQLAQAAGAPASAPHIGRVTTLSGTASAVRGADTIPLAIGDQILLGDVVQTGDASSLGITLADRTVFTMAARARMVLNELIYDPARTDNSFAATLVQGTFVFVTGQVAKTGTMQVTTPVATMGIRGTTPTVNIDANNGVTLFGIAPDPGTGIVGSYTILELNTQNVIGTVSGITDRFRLGGAGQPIEVAPIIPQELLTTTQQIINLAYSTFNISPPLGDPSLGGGPSGTPGSGTPTPGPTPPPSQAPTQDSPQAPPPIENRGQGPGGPQFASSATGGTLTALLTPTFLPDDPLLRGNNTPSVLLQERPVDPLGPSITPVSLSFSGIAATVEDTSIIISGFSFASAPGGSLTVSMSAGSTITLRSTAGLTFTPTGPDNDGVDDHTLSFTGSAADVLAALNGLIYTPTPNAESGGRLSITITDGRTTSSTQIGVNITATPDAPIQTASVYLISEDSTSVAGNFVAIDPDSGSSIAAAEILSQPSSGNVILTGGSGFQWIAGTSFDSLAAGQTLDITFTARVQDNTGLWSAPSQQTIRVVGVNDAPVVNLASSTYSGTLAEDNATTTLGGNLVATDVDAGASLSWSLTGTASFDGLFYVQTGTYGTFYINSAGSWNYIIDNFDADTNALSTGQVVTDTFTALVSDGLGGTATQVVTATINGADEGTNINVTNAQNEMALASIQRADGTTLVLYVSVANPATSSLPSTILGRVIDASGNVVGGEITFNLSAPPSGFTYELQNFKAAELAGDILLAFDASSAASSDNFVFLTRFQSTGNFIDSRQLGSSSSSDHLYRLGDLDIRSDGGFDVLAYKATTQNYVRASFNSSAQYQSESTVLLNSAIPGLSDALSINTPNNGKILIYSSGYSNTSSNPMISALFDGQTTPYSMSLPTAASAIVNLQKLSLTPDGSVLILAEYEVQTPSGTTTDNLHVFRITPAGTWTTPVTIAGPTGDYETDYIFPSDILALADGSFVIAYERQIGGVSEGLIRHYAADGTALTAEISLGFSGGQDGFPHLTQLANGNVLVTYSGTDSAADSNGMDVYTYTFVPATGSIINGTSAGETLNGTSNADVIYGLAGNDIINGNDGNDTIYGGDGEDTINGGAGDDVINPGTNSGGLSGYDSIIASAGDDTFNFTGAGGGFFDLAYTSGTAFSSIAVTIFGAYGYVFKSGAYSGTDTLVNLDAIDGNNGGIGIAGTPGADTFTVTLSDATDFLHIRPGEGNDIFYLDTLGTIRPDYRNAPSGITVNLSLASGQVINDGWGGTDTFLTRAGGAPVAGTIDEIAGSFFTDNITGSNFDDRFILNGGNDTVNGGAGVDLVRYDRNGVTNLNVDLSTGTATGSWNGAAFTHSLTSIERIRGSFGDDILKGSSANETFEGRGGNDLFIYQDGDDIITDFSGGVGISDKIDLTAFTGITNFAQLLAIATQSGMDTVFNFGQDSLTLKNVTLANLVADDFMFASANTINGTTGSDILNGTAGNDVINGLGGTDQFFGLAGNDILNGGSTLDYFVGGAGNDILNGFGDIDTVDYSQEISQGGSSGVVVNLTTETATDSFGNADTLISIENVRGTQYNDNITGNSVYNALLGYAGDDILNSGGGDDLVWGGSGNDTLDGGEGRDLLEYSYDSAFSGAVLGVTVNLANGTATDGFGNQDIVSNFEDISGTMSDDILTGNDGDNEINGYNGTNSLYGRGGNDILHGGGNTDTLYGGTGNDVLNGSGGNDNLYGGAGDDTLNGGSGTDTISYANDISEGGTQGVTVNLTTGTATDGFGNTDTLTSIENVTGSAYGDTLVGTSANNVLIGFDGNDTLTGGGGIDTLLGGYGNDLLILSGGGFANGEDGQDTIRFDATGATNLSTFDAITITGFNTSEDKIDLDSLFDAFNTPGAFSSFTATLNSGVVSLSVTYGVTTQTIATITGDTPIVSGATINVIDENNAAVAVTVS